MRLPAGPSGGAAAREAETLCGFGGFSRALRAAVSGPCAKIFDTPSPLPLAGGRSRRGVVA